MLPVVVSATAVTVTLTQRTCYLSDSSHLRPLPTRVERVGVLRLFLAGRPALFSRTCPVSSISWPAAMSKPGLPSMMEATIGEGGGMDVGAIPSSAAAIEDVTAAFADALKVASLPVVRTACGDVLAYVAAGDMLASTTKPQLQALLKAVLSTLASPSKVFHAAVKVRGGVATAARASLPSARPCASAVSRISPPLRHFRCSTDSGGTGQLRSGGGGGWRADRRH